MAPSTQNHPIRLEGDFHGEDLTLLRARIEEGISQLSCSRVEFASVNRSIDLNMLVGAPLSVVMEVGESDKRSFRGTCVSAEFLGTHGGAALYAAEIRPWLWFLTRRRNCRIFQDMNTPDIIQEVLSDYGFWGHVKKSLTGTYEARTLCIQYRESDLEFLHRLMEEDGIYYFFSHNGPTEEMVLADAVSAHVAIGSPSDLKFHDLTSATVRPSECIFEWSASGAATTGKVTLNDYNFEKPKADLKAANAIPKGTHSHKGLEAYTPPGHYRETGTGDRFARIRMEAEAARHRVWTGAANVPRLEVGRTFDLTGLDRKSDVTSFMITRAVHQLQLNANLHLAAMAPTPLSREIGLGVGNAENYRVTFATVAKSEQYRAPLVTPWPEIPGIQTAIVTGPAGEEIHTDKYGRVRIQFHWDREGKSDETSTCWVRTMMPWTGKNWGMIAIPRVGQEVVVQFEEGDPDRPVVIGMLYNADTMPPYALPANMTQSGVKTNSSKGGSGYNELMFEDKKGAELVRFKAERDYAQVVQNNATVTIGLEDKSDGDMSLTVHNNLTETVKTGNHSFSVEKGSQKIDIKTDKTEVIEGKSDLTVTGNVTETVKSGNVTRTLNTGDEATTLKGGNYTIDVKMGKVAVTAMQEISLKVGGSSVVINQAGVTIKGPMVKIEGTAMLEAKGKMTTVKGDALLILKGGMTMIN